MEVTGARLTLRRIATAPPWQFGRTALQLAAEMGHYLIVKALV